MYRGSRFTDSAVGVVILTEGTLTYKICSSGFTDQHASLVCRQLGFLQAIVGDCPDGPNVRLSNCTFTVSECSDSSFNYAAVSCRNGDAQTVPIGSFKFDSNLSFPESGYFSPLLIYEHNVWGHVCAEKDIDDEFRIETVAALACRQKGFQQGRALYLSSNWTIPALRSEVNCGSAAVFGDCGHVQGNCRAGKILGVVCQPPDSAESSFYLTGGKHNYGRVVVSAGGQEGLICAEGFTWKEALVLCRQLGYTTGSVNSEVFDSGDVDTVVLSRVSCDSYEEPDLYHCDIHGWRNVSNSCQGTAQAVSVFCYVNVRLVGVGTETDEVHLGRLQVLHGGLWYSVCAETLSQAAANVVCREQGFSTAEILLPSEYRGTQSKTINSLNCTGLESSIKECPYTTGACDPDLNAAVLCRNSIQSDTYTFSVPGRDGAVTVDRLGLKGYICRGGLDNMAAQVACRQAGYQTGVVLGHQVMLRIIDARYEATSPQDYTCAKNFGPAGVLCYNSSLPDSLVRLNAGKDEVHGRVEVYHDMTGWGTICYMGWTNADSAVVCKELGFASGQSNPSAYNEIADISVQTVLSNVDCEGTESSILACPNAGWGLASSLCTHNKDAGVFCYKHVRLVPGSTYGSVQYHSGEEYGLVCADGFDQQAADVVCKEMGHQYSIPLCCSAMGPSDRTFTLGGVKCTGNEASLRDCQYTVDDVSCISGQYAAVVCSDFQIGYTKLNTADTLVKLTYFLRDGYICSDDFSHLDAKVICTQQGYLYGRAYKASAKGLEKKIRWLRGLYCTGDEVTTDLRLVDGTESSGRVEVKVKGIWGTLCDLDLTRMEVKVICRELGYRAGRIMTSGHFGPGSGNIALTGLKCNGSESSFSDCVWAGFGQSGSAVCDHSSDAAVACFSDMRLSGFVTANYGFLEMYDPNTDQWLTTCATNFNVHNAVVICHQMGYRDGLVQKVSSKAANNVQFFIREVDCVSQTDCTFTTGECSSKTTIALYCSETEIGNEDVALRLPLSVFYGPVEVQRFGMWGHLCSSGFDDNDAMIVCKQIGYQAGSAVNTYRTENYPIIQGTVSCTGDENQLQDCQRALFAELGFCYDDNTVAGVICYNGDTDIQFRSNPLDYERGEMSTRLEIQAGENTLLVAGHPTSDISAAVYCSGLGYAGGNSYSAGSGSYGVVNMSCPDNAASILQCVAAWDPEKTRGKSGSLAGATCFTAVRLIQGDPTFYGAVLVSRGTRQGLVCAEGFTKKEASDESQLTDCPHEVIPANQAALCQKNYAAVVCYTGNKPSDYTLSLPIPGSYIGHLQVRYLNVSGSVCFDGWDDVDASVACRELGYRRGIAYNAARTVEGPYWMSNVKCTGTESRLGDCEQTQLGSTSDCVNKLSHAGAVCYDNEVEVSLNGEWRSLCNTHWDDVDAQVLCRMLEFRTGEAFHGGNLSPMSGSVWEVNIACGGGEGSLNQCLSSEWTTAISSSCARHQRDSGAFCYTSVKLSTGVGRETDKGAVLLYWGETWHTVCSDGFTDLSAATVCRELGFRDGQAQCCDLYEKIITVPTDPNRFEELPIVIAVVVFVVLVLIAVLVFCLYKCHKKRRQADESKVEFHNNIVEEHHHSSLRVVNPLHGVSTPEIVRASFTRRGNEELARISPTINNPDYGGNTPQDAQIPRNSSHIYNSIINVDPHTYDNRNDRQQQNNDPLSNTYLTPVPSHMYDKIRVSQLGDGSDEFTSITPDNAGQGDGSDEFTSITPDNAGQGPSTQPDAGRADRPDFRTSLADQQEVSSPTNFVNHTQFPVQTTDGEH
ncbi:C163B-like protein [Mya arenaria]|uniref:C163B-like protein n=1 Tax=Mya arenaria TaxID=6604 RepID=A0ABY7DTI5_MYAAR|nr:C163B-like protein [Mya arenaria]